MAYAVRFTSLKGADSGETRFERYDTIAEARKIASIMRAGGHRDATAIKNTDCIAVRDTVNDDRPVMWVKVLDNAENVCAALNTANYKNAGPLKGGRYWVDDMSDLVEAFAA